VEFDTEHWPPIPRIRASEKVATGEEGLFLILRLSDSLWLREGLAPDRAPLAGRGWPSF